MRFKLLGKNREGNVITHGYEILYCLVPKLIGKTLTIETHTDPDIYDLYHHELIIDEERFTSLEGFVERYKTSPFPFDIIK